MYCQNIPRSCQHHITPVSLVAEGQHHDTAARTSSNEEPQPQIMCRNSDLELNPGLGVSVQHHDVHVVLAR